MTLYLGLMSGTSMDGIDIALIEHVASPHFVVGHTYPYSAFLKTLIEEVIDSPSLSYSAFFHCHQRIGEEFAFAVNEFLSDQGIDKTRIHGIGSHGQTILHAPDAKPSYTVQLGCGHTIAAKTGIQVVADFRSRDMVLGGQGAPLAPLFHQVLFSDEKKPVAILNIGGIANLTYLLTNGSVKGFDVGPGNGLLDSWIFENLGRAYDKSGEWAATGMLIPDLLKACLDDPFFSLAPPKSLDKHYFSKHWLEKKLNATYAPEDIQATLLALTAHAISITLQQEPVFPNLFVCGGGVHNLTLMKQLSQLLPEIQIKSTESIGVDPDYVEAMMCAWLASQTLSHRVLDMQPITGGKTTLLGCIYPV